MSKIEEITKIVNFLKKYKIENATINKVNDDFIVDVKGSVHLSGKNLTEIPFQFGTVIRFDCSHNKLITLKGCPKKVYKGFYCYNNQLETLDGSPHYVGGYFECYDNKLKSLKGIGEVNGKIHSDFFEGYLEDYKGEL